MALAEDKVSSRVNLYVDNDETTIVSPMIYVQKNIFDETSLSVRYITDIQSCASVDVVSTASPSRGYEEIRHEVAAGLKHRINLTSFGATYRHSTENDYDSNSVSASFSQELFQRNFTVDLSVSYRKDKIGRVKDRTFSKDLEGGGGSVSLTQILTPKVIGQFVYYLEVLDGYQSSPYRLVPVADFHVPETHPDRRIRQSFTGRLKESLSEAWGAEQSFRFYTDTWGLNSKTIFLQFYYHINNPLTLRLRYRFYNQERADFYRE